MRKIPCRSYLVYISLVVVATTNCSSLYPTRLAPGTTPEVVVDRVLRQTPLIDGHNDLIVHFVDCPACPREPESYDIGSRTLGRTDIPRWRIGRLGGQLLNAGWLTGVEDVDGTLKGFDLVERLVQRHADDLTLARTASDIRAAHRDGKIAVLLALENGRRFRNSTRVVRELAKRGLRSNILAYNEGTELADGATGPRRYGGLSEAGEMIVREMNRTGILIDLSHASDETAHDVLDITQTPVIFSHSSVRSLATTPRNVPDDILARLPSNGGIVMITFVDVYTTQEAAEWWTRYEAARAALEAANAKAIEEIMQTWGRNHPPPRVTVADVANHFEYVRRIAGVDHVGIGSDFDGDPSVIEGLEDVSKYPNLLLELARRGWSEEDLRKVAGENFLRVLELANAVARRKAGYVREVSSNTSLEQTVTDEASFLSRHRAAAQVGR